MKTVTYVPGLKCYLCARIGPLIGTGAMPRPHIRFEISCVQTLGARELARNTSLAATVSIFSHDRRDTDKRNSASAAVNLFLTIGVSLA